MRIRITLFIVSKDPYVPNFNLIFHHLLTQKMSSILFSVALLLGSPLFSKIKTDIDSVNMDDAQSLSWLITYETFRLARYLEKSLFLYSSSG